MEALEAGPGALVAPALAADARTVAVGWATVELDRAALELAAELGIASDRFGEAVGSPLLGARCRLAVGLLPDDVAVVLLEPDTEGRLAGRLARFGEGPAAVWLGVADIASAADALRLAGVATSIDRPGPFGLERLVHGWPASMPSGDPDRLLVRRAGTIRA
jgi:hypothetical protein